MCLLKTLEADRARMLPQVRSLCDEVDAALYENFKFPKGRKQKRHNVDGRAITVQFTKTNGERIPDNAGSRLKAIEKYREQIENGGEIQYDINEDMQFSSMLKFAATAVESGWMAPLTEDE